MTRDIERVPARSGFSHVDATPDPDWHVQYLDRAAMVPMIAEWKQIACRLLDLQRGNYVLDAGCGTGNDVRAYAHLVGPAGRVVGVDRSIRMVTEAHARAASSLLPVAFAQASLVALPFADGTFDCGRAERVFHHLDDPGTALAELVRVTRSGGAIVVMDADLDTIIIDATDRDVTRRIVHFAAEARAQPWGARQLPALFRHAGLREITVIPLTQIVTRLRDSDVNGDVAAMACSAGVITVDEAAAWTADLEQRDAAGDYLQTMTLFTVAGRKS